MSVMNRPDGGPQPRHAIERDGDAWTAIGSQVVSGAVPRSPRARTTCSCSSAAPEYAGPRPGNVARRRVRPSDVADAIEPYARDELDLVAVRYTPRLADLVPDVAADATLGPAAWSGYLAFDHCGPGALERRAPAGARARGRPRALDAERARELRGRTGGIVPPALQGHTPDIVPRVRPGRGAGLPASVRASADVRLQIGGYVTWVHPFLDTVTSMWRDVLGIESDIRPWTIEQASHATS